MATTPATGNTPPIANLTPEELTQELATAIANSDTTRSTALVDAIRARMLSDNTMITALQHINSSNANALTVTT